MNTEFSHARRVIQTGDAYQVVTPIRQPSDRAALRYYIAQYKLGKRQLSEANTAKDSGARNKALKRISVYRSLSLDLMIEMRQKQVTSAYERNNRARIEDAIDCASLKAGLFGDYQRKCGVV